LPDFSGIGGCRILFIELISVDDIHGDWKLTILTCIVDPSRLKSRGGKSG
jgi:hypothetical protein